MLIVSLRERVLSLVSRRELFVFLEMGSSVEDVELCFVHSDLGDNSNTDLDSVVYDSVVEFFEQMFDDFDIERAQCYECVRTLCRRAVSSLYEQGVAFPRLSRVRSPVQRDQLLGIIGTSGVRSAPVVRS